MNLRQKKKKLKLYNMKLCERYPFLIPRNVWTDKIIDGFNYNYTNLDSMPPGWKKAFGVLMCEEIRNALIKDDLLDKYRILQIKEKYGGLRWYSNFYTSELRDIICKYEYISEHICDRCGRVDAPMINYHGWEVVCDKCINDPRVNYENIIVSHDFLENYITITSYDNENGFVEREIDISDTLNKIRRGYHVRI